METATVIETFDPKSGDHIVRPGGKAVYRLSKPMKGYDDRESDYVFVSTATVLGEVETYAFLANEKGEVISWSELPCSMKGTSSHAEVLGEAGYEIVDRSSHDRGKP